MSILLCFPVLPISACADANKKIAGYVKRTPQRMPKRGKLRVYEAHYLVESKFNTGLVQSFFPAFANNPLIQAEIFLPSLSFYL